MSHRAILIHGTFCLATLGVLSLKLERIWQKRGGSIALGAIDLSRQDQRNRPCGQR